MEAWGIAAIATLALLSGCGARKARDGADPPQPVFLAAGDVARIVRCDLAEGVPVSGTLRPDVDIRITAPLGEVVEQVLVREGEAVRSGQVLARLRLTALDAAASSAQAALKIAAADYERQNNLLREGAVAERDVQAAEAQLRLAEANGAQASKRLEDATVRAPVAGVIAVRSVQAGDRVSDGDPMFQLVNTAELEFEATVPSEFVPLVKPGAPVRLSVSGFASGGVVGRVARVNATADPATRQVRVYLSVPNPGGALVGGLFASGTIVTREARQALAVPGAAVRGEAASAFVMLVRGGRLARVEVKPGLRDESRDLVEMLSGVAEGDTAVTGPIQGLRPGQPVQFSGRGG